MHTRLHDLKERCHELNDQVGPLQSHVDRLKGELQDEYSRNSKLQSDLERLQTQNSDLNYKAVLWDQNEVLLKMLLEHKQRELR